MATGRDLAKFVTQMTGENYLGFYDEAEKYDEAMKNEAKERFGSLLERIERVDKNKISTILD